MKTLIDIESTGEMAEWSKAHAWKVCIPQKGIVGSNPTLSAKDLNHNQFPNSKQTHLSL